MTYREDPEVSDDRQFAQYREQIIQQDMEEYCEEFHERLNDMYSYTEDGFCDGFTKY